MGVQLRRSRLKDVSVSLRLRAHPLLPLRPRRPLRLVRLGARPQVLLEGALPLINTNGHSSSSSTYRAEKYSSSVSSANGGLPHRESHHDSTYRSTRVGDSGIPHTSYNHSSSSYDSDRPYKNAVSNFSYNI